VLTIEVANAEYSKLGLETNLGGENSAVGIADAEGQRYDISDIKTPEGVDRFDTDGDNEIEQLEVVNVINAYYQGSTIGGEPVGVQDVLDVINAFYAN